MNEVEGNYSLSTGVRPILVKTVIHTLDVMSKVLVLSADTQDPYSDVIVPPELLVPPADRQLLTKLHESRLHIERAACELTASPDRATFTCPKEQKVAGLLAATMIATLEEVLGHDDLEAKPAAVVRDCCDLYRICAHALVNMHLKAVRSKPAATNIIALTL